MILRHPNRVPLLLAAAVVVLLIAFAGGYGPHRDELYFLASGRHLAWAYPDNGVLPPLVARAMSAIAPGSLTLLRVPSALAAGATVFLTGLLARELGAGRRGRLLATACAAVASVVLVTGHLLSTSTFDLVTWTAVTWLVVRAVRTGEDRLWPVAGVVLGVGLVNKPLPAFLAVALLAGVVVSGPRRLLRNRSVWFGAAIAVAIWSPWLAWQAAHGWPQIEVSSRLGPGASTSSQPWWALVPYQVLLVSPVLAPVWIAGLVRLFRDPGVRDVRFLAWAWVVLAIVLMANSGKPYYLAGLLPVLIAAGAKPVDAWLDRGRPRLRRDLLVAAIVLSAAVDATIALPVLPARLAGPVVAVNPDAGETIGWNDFVRAVARVRADAPGRRAVILTTNYGEAGAIQHYAPRLAPVYSGHNAYAEWGPPPAGAAPVIAVGGRLARKLRGCRVAARIANRAGVDNEEHGVRVLLCAGPRAPWSREWPALRHLN